MKSASLIAELEAAFATAFDLLPLSNGERPEFP
jgi:hypothetical protein